METALEAYFKTEGEAEEDLSFRTEESLRREHDLTLLAANRARIEAEDRAHAPTSDMNAIATSHPKPAPEAPPSVGPRGGF